MAAIGSIIYDWSSLPRDATPTEKSWTCQWPCPSRSVGRAWACTEDARFCIIPIDSNGGTVSTDRDFYDKADNY